MRFPALGLIITLAATVAASQRADAASPGVDRPVDFVADIQPLLRAACYSCHGPTAHKGGLRLDVKPSALGSGAIVPGRSADSPLYRRVAGLADEPRMPPRGRPLTARQIALLGAWIEQGARWPDLPDPPASVRSSHWACRPLVRPRVPASRASAWARNPIDVFVLARLETAGLTPSSEADRRTLIRRVSFDLLGLPPTPEEIDSYLADPSPQAYEHLVDRLLASPGYGERWARHWMDVIHFAETHGHDQDAPREHAWPYRDYLIRSFNADKPWQRFVAEQVAGDVVWPDDPDAIVATGFLAAGPWDESSQKDILGDTLDKQIAQVLDRDDIVTTTLSAFTSTTIHCARCHDHKFDPITQAEYYGLQAVFAGVDRADRSYDPDPQVAQTRLALRKRLVELDSALPSQQALQSAGRRVQERASADAQRLLRNNVRRQLKKLPAPQQVYAGTSDFTAVGNFQPANGCRPVALLRRGDVRSPGPAAVPCALSCVRGLSPRFQLANPADEGQRRAALARWLAHRDNVLTWRSVVNRVWHYHFGRGIVATPSDLGHMGAAPTHRELLDWLAVWFRDDAAGSLKALHRLIVTSATYRQSSDHRATCAAGDQDNLLLWRMNRMRLDAEQVHDAVLSVSGRLDRTMGGPSVKNFVQGKGIHVTPTVDYLAYDLDAPGSGRRSVYRFIFRTLPDPFLEALDCPDASQFTPVRSSSITALQALALLNDRFLLRQAQHFAERLRGEGDVASQVRRAFLLTLGRPPEETEAVRLTRYAQRHGMANACRLLLNCNEFLFVP